MKRYGVFLRGRGKHALCLMRYTEPSFLRVEMYGSKGHIGAVSRAYLDEVDPLVVTHPLPTAEQAVVAKRHRRV